MIVLPFTQEHYFAVNRWRDDFWTSALVIAQRVVEIRGPLYRAPEHPNQEVPVGYLREVLAESFPHDVVVIDGVVRVTIEVYGAYCGDPAEYRSVEFPVGYLTDPAWEADEIAANEVALKSLEAKEQEAARTFMEQQEALRMQARVLLRQKLVSSAEGFAALSDEDQDRIIRLSLGQS